MSAKAATTTADPVCVGNAPVVVSGRDQPTPARHRLRCKYHSAVSRPLAYARHRRKARCPEKYAREESIAEPLEGLHLDAGVQEVLTRALRQSHIRLT